MKRLFRLIGKVLLKRYRGQLEKKIDLKKFDRELSLKLDALSVLVEG